MPRVNLYIKDEDKAAYDRFIKATERDGTSASKVFSEAMRDWMRVHEPGNPQTLLPSFSDTGHMTLANIEGRIRQMCIEKNNNEGKQGINFNYIHDLVKELMKLSGKKSLIKTDEISQWLHEKSIKIWR